MLGDRMLSSRSQWVWHLSFTPIDATTVTTSRLVELLAAVTDVCAGDFTVFSLGLGYSLIGI